jgi:acylglycerol lipase
MRFSRRAGPRGRVLPGILLLGALAACAPVTRPAGEPVMAPAYADDALTMADATPLALHAWLPSRPPRAVILALHGYNDYGNAFDLPATRWAEKGIATFAYDQRGFGQSAMPGLWPGTASLVADAEAAVALIARRHPGVPLVLLGESMGGAVTALVIARDPPPELSAAVLVAPAVWGQDAMPWGYRASLWLLAHIAPGMELSGSGLEIWPSDNIPMLRALGQDPLVIKGSRADAVLGLVRLMDSGQASAGEMSLPVLLVYGEQDQIVPREAMMLYAGRLNGPVRFATYPQGYHMLLRDLGRALPVDDIASFVLDPAAPLPSGNEERSREFLFPATN